MSPHGVFSKEGSPQEEACFLADDAGLPYFSRGAGVENSATPQLDRK